ncbi:uncharacterized protein CXorf49 homolog [Peromyscus maniculatus bairdii]|uniref:RIKEN cDNA 8030474K03 gene n=1 Tax=Peromyscus maniculatus bairdii TaxID=230844 RepID=A0A6J0DH10_PERMB|nr:uncharacterized protein CXorf49 homolog [Peromyscus maniculatus bairdii]
MSSPDEVAAPGVRGDKDAASTGDMNSRDQGSAPEAHLGQEGREHLGDPLISPRVPRGSSLIQGPREIGEGEGGRPGMEGCEVESGRKLEATQEGEGVLRDPEGRPSSPVDQEEVGLDFLPQLSIEAKAMMRELTNLQTRKVCRYQSPQTCAAELAALWGCMDEGSNRGALSLSSVEGKQTSAGSLYPRGLGRGRAWVTPRRGTTSRIVSSEAVQCPSYNPTSSDESNETRVMRVTICLKEGGQAKSTGSTEREDTGKHASVHGRGSFVHVPHSVLSSANRTLSSGGEKQALGELEGSLSKKKPSVVWGTEGSRPSFPGATSAAPAAGAAASAAVPAPTPAASGALPKTSPRKKAPQEKKPLTDVSRGSLGGTFPPWGQRLKSAPVRSATLPPISGVALLGKATKRPMISGPKECKPFCTGKRSMARKTKESQPGAKEDNDPTRDPGLQAQLPTHRAEQPCTCTHRGEMSSGDPNTRAPQVAGNSQFLSLSQRSARPRAPAPAGDQDILVCPLLPAEEGEPVLQGTPGCPQCLMLRKEIEELKEQLAIMQALNEKFQDL